VDLQNALSQRLQLVSRRETNRGVKQAPFIVLTGADMPAVLSEISFVSNASNERLLLKSGQRQRVAEGLHRSIAAYLESSHSLPHKKQKLVLKTVRTHHRDSQHQRPQSRETPVEAGHARRVAATEEEHISDAFEEFDCFGFIESCDILPSGLTHEIRGLSAGFFP
jgi:hypothetical protein